MIAGLDRQLGGLGLLQKIEHIRVLLNSVANISGDGKHIAVEQRDSGTSIRFVGDLATSGESADAEVTRFKITSVSDNYVVGKEVDENDAVVGDVTTSIAKHEYLRGSAAPVVYAVDDIILAVQVKGGTGVVETGNQPPRVNRVGIVHIRKSDNTVAKGTTAETVAAQSDTWDREAQGNNRGFVDTRLTRMGYDDTAGTPALRAYYRDSTYDSDGRLALRSAETAVVIFTPVVCS